MLVDAICGEGGSSDAWVVVPTSDSTFFTGRSIDDKRLEDVRDEVRLEARMPWVVIRKGRLGRRQSRQIRL
jgi:hypothetical protein